MTGSLCLGGAATVGRARLEGTLPGPSHRLGACEPPRLGLRYKVAPPLCFAQDAVSLHPLPKAAQQLFLSFAFPELYIQLMAFLITADRRRGR